MRTVDISRPGSFFARASFIESAGRKLGADLAQENRLRGLEKPEFVARLALYYSEWNAVHPFREGNGRATRELLRLIALQAGYLLDQTRIDNREGQWQQAARQSFHGDLEPVKRIFDDALVADLRARKHAS